MEHTTVNDRNFDDLADRLERKVYGSPKGELRLELLWDDLQDTIVEIDNSHTLKILDAGGGFGQISKTLIDKGHNIVLCDISEKMLQGAAKTAGQHRPDNLSLIHSSFQNLPVTLESDFDIVMSHAVLEWLAEPEKSLKKLLKFIKPGGYLSLLFYNVHSLVYQNAIKGNFRKIMAEDFRGDPNSLTPLNPATPEEVYTWLEDSGIELVTKTGIRVFYDYMSRPLRQNRSYEDIFEIEKEYCKKEPYASLGRYIHIVGKRKQ